MSSRNERGSWKPFVTHMTSSTVALPDNFSEDLFGGSLSSSVHKEIDLTQHVHVKLATVELHVQETLLCTAKMTSVHDVVDGHISTCHERIVSRTGMKPPRKSQHRPSHTAPPFWFVTPLTADTALHPSFVQPNQTTI